MDERRCFIRMGGRTTKFIRMDGWMDGVVLIRMDGWTNDVVL